jgi:hypothetical protein
MWDEGDLPEPVVGGGDGGHADTQLYGCYFGAVEEVGAEETDGDEEVVHEDEKDTSDRCGLVGGGERSCNS